MGSSGESQEGAPMLLEGRPICNRMALDSQLILKFKNLRGVTDVE